MAYTDNINTEHTVRLFTVGGFFGTRGGEAEYALENVPEHPRVFYSTEFEDAAPGPNEDRYVEPDSWCQLLESASEYAAVRELLRLLAT